ncbi:MafI family immunity protein [Jatrophihabitans fulvus]
MTSALIATFHTLLNSLGTRIAAHRRADILDWLDHNEAGLAVDTLMDAMVEDEVILSDVERRQIFELIAAMGWTSDRYGYFRRESRPPS